MGDANLSHPLPTAANGSQETHLTCPDTETGWSQERGLTEEAVPDDYAVPVTANYPVIPNADALNERLAEAVDQRVGNFTVVNPSATGFEADWEISVAADGIVGVRMTWTEEDSQGEHLGYETHWYDAETGRAAYSTELLAGQEQLEALNELVIAQLEGEEISQDALQPVLGLYDSIAFNDDGNLVVEFDEGQVAPESEGRVSAVIASTEAAPLLSNFGTHAQEAARAVEEDFTAEVVETIGEATPVPGRMEDWTESIDCTDSNTRCVALTFDDGPGSRTPDLLDTLAEHDAPATFFQTGEMIDRYPETVRRAYAEGHQLGNHTINHPDLTPLDAAEIRDELAPVNEQIWRLTGDRPVIQRPPYGATNETVAEVSQELGLAQILWNVDTEDWKDRDSEIVAQRALDDAQPGAIILMHDIHDTTVDAVPAILEGLAEDGYTLATVSDLLGETEPGELYYSRGRPTLPPESGPDA
ncbi:peptidoglycan/xylan/chitin deacetylase (PgdA/CDA1 family) [Lipingzhangella halophila]|uniref:Peptidoglycan/xylan/chitin deacetylase (PgdA/CDA1 family) n=1 Tax=Lipingzhangella halophila TaxID=1783352 RepID=A0A7W7REW0_9ACTN|nr:polysaccharide deacetylase family protein [Lipingzhangella halophila]MBB4930666.1 peptidoglycan/xylan/chitin deacetylase (PgdA/CDA1 family) [Lipingzhangella halophila]